MTRKQYLADLLAAGNVHHFGNIANVQQAADDGMFTFEFRHPTSGVASEVTVMVEPSEYPKSHSYRMFGADDALPTLASCLENCPGISGKPIQDVLPIISAFITAKTATGGVLDPFNIDSDEPLHSSEEGDGSDEDEFEFDLDSGSKITRPTVDPAVVDRIDSETCMTRARADLRAVKEAGFKVGFSGSLSPSNSCYISISCRISKLGISDEAQDAWYLNKDDYLILLISYPHGYRSLDFVESVSTTIVSDRMVMRVGISDHYKLRSAAEARSVFDLEHEGGDVSRQDATAAEVDRKGFRAAFISGPLNALLKDRLIHLISYRRSKGLSWAGAHKFYNDMVSGIEESTDDGATGHSDAIDANKSLPTFVTQDHLTAVASPAELSLPLLSMQLLLRHFVRCTEFCLVCFSKLDTNIEAIKPYVCANPLCLYQFMALGFGPSIEHEITAQPYVADLLISFCYASACSCNLHEYPDGLGLSVPNPAYHIQGTPIPVPCPTRFAATRHEKTTTAVSLPLLLPQVTAKFDFKMSTILFGTDIKTSPFKAGQWLVLNPVTPPDQSWHCRVLDVNRFPTLSVTSPFIVNAGVDAQVPPINGRKPDVFPIGPTDVMLHAYDHNMNGLGNVEMSKTIIAVLATLPSIQDMTTYLAKHPGKPLSSWRDRITPAALGLLRWIIASNRSCIVQVDQLEGDADVRRDHQTRIPHFDHYMQFRFAMGAPDKEQRFLESIKAETGTKPYPTIFAWHGSPLHNWHSIIRQGLHAGKVSNGRAYGDGVYHAKEMTTSASYSHNPATAIWPRGRLKFGSTIALSEIVNAPAKFTSQHPFYVVAQTDWIQTRYLLISLQPGGPTIVKYESDDPSREILPQDPEHTPMGSDRRLVLPLSAIPKSRRKEAPPSLFGQVSPATGNPKHKKRPASPTSLDGLPDAKKFSTKLTSKALNLVPGSHTPDTTDDDTSSIQTEVEDLKTLFDPEDRAPDQLQDATSKITDPVTKFEMRPLRNLPLTPRPTYANPNGVKRLLKDYEAMLKIQAGYMSKGELAVNGWYIDPDFMAKNENIYQWIVELHSFPLSSTLGNDMQAHNVQSIVLEVRFPENYPMGAPFVRVVRPRFLAFAQGGGGHITAGGSICTELLTSSGWSPACSIETVFMQIRSDIMSTDPRPARLLVAVESGAHGVNSGDYGVHEAVDSFKRTAMAHQWKIPEGIDATAGLHHRSTARAEGVLWTAK